MTRDTLGQRILLGVAGTVVLVAAVLGFVIGSNGAEVVPESTVFGVLTLPTTPLSMALYGAVLATVLLGGLFASVEGVSRLEADEGPRP